MYKLAYTPEAREQIGSLQKEIRSQLKKAIDRLAVEPKLGKRLAGDLDGLWSYRSGDWRIIYQVHQNELLIVIIAVGDRIPDCIPRIPDCVRPDAVRMGTR